MKEELIQLFEEAQELIKKFSKRNYEIGFQNQYEKYKEILEDMDVRVEATEDKDAAILEIASIIPEYMKEKISALKSKRKAESFIVDYNYAMVTYVLPLINYTKKENCNQISEKIVEIWNEEITKTPIKNSTYESIYAGFGQRMCYITTAVCESLGKPDDCYELQLLRGYRDEYLIASEEGKKIVEQYYDIAPTIVKHINQTERSKEVYEEIYEKYLLTCIDLVEKQKMEECKEVYSSMVRELQKKYLYA